VAEVATNFLVQAIDADGPQETLREIVAPSSSHGRRRQGAADSARPASASPGRG
jgi:hypothetical protein